MNLSEYISNYIEAHGLSQRAFAARCGVSHGYISFLIRGENPKTGEPITPQLGRLKLIAAGMGMTLEDLFRAVDDLDVDISDGSPTITEDVVSFPVLGDVAAGYDRLAVMNDVEMGEKIDIPRSYLRGRPASDYFVLKVCGDSMWPMYLDGDKVLVLHQSTMNRSGEIGVVVYGDEAATLKKIEYTMGEDWMRLVPLNLNKYQPELIEGERLEHCRVLGIPRMVIREIVD